MSAPHAELPVNRTEMWLTFRFTQARGKRLIPMSQVTTIYCA